MFDPTTAAIRFGTGLSLEAPLPARAQALIDEVTGPDDVAARYPLWTDEEAWPLRAAFEEARQSMRKTDTDETRAAYKAARAALVDRRRMGLAAQLARGIFAPIGFRERLQVFWSDHFTVRSRIVAWALAPTAFCETAIRPHIAGRFADMLRAAVTHPAMLVYLDQQSSIGPNSQAGRRRHAGLNENLAREVIELHTLGVGAAYSQADVRQFAELLTGMGLGRHDRFSFQPERAEPGAETVLGVAYPGEKRAALDAIYKALDDLAAHPDTARHLARKLAVHFVADEPDPDLVETMARAYLAADTDLTATYRALLAHPAAWERPAVKARQPWDFIVASLRLIGTSPLRFSRLTAREVRRGVETPLARMGQPWQKPSGPNGWPEDAAAWITPLGLAERIRWASNLGRLHGARLPDARALVAGPLAGVAPPALGRAVAQAENGREALALVLASPAMNRR